MPRPLPERSRLKAEILARVRAGEPLNRVGGAGATPRARTVYKWAKTDAAFRAELKDAVRRGAWRRTYAFDEAKAAALLTRVRAGERVAHVVGQPGMPGWQTYRYWRRTQAEFGEAVWALDQRRKARLGLMSLARARPFDPAMADRIIARANRGEQLAQMQAADAAIPGREVLRRWRRETPEFDRVLGVIRATWRRRRRRAAAPAPEMVDAIMARIVEGASLASLGRQPDMPSARTLYRWAATYPDFARAVEQAREDREEWLREQMLGIAEAAGPDRKARAEARRRIRGLNRELGRLQARREAGGVRS